MQFIVSTTKSWYTTDAKNALERLGLQFEPGEEAFAGEWQRHGQGRVELGTLQDLLDFQQQCGVPVILKGHTLEIYDEYRE